MPRKPTIPEREYLAYRVELRNSIFRQLHRRLGEFKKMGYTQKKIAERLGMNEGQLSRLLRGDTDLRLETLTDLARALNCRIDATVLPLNARLGPSTRSVTIEAGGSDATDFASTATKGRPVLAGVS